MKKTSLLFFGLFASVTVALVGCGDKVSDPEALLQKYLKDAPVREKKIKECNLLSADEQAKSQSCEIARNAEKELAHQQLKKKGFVDFKPVEIDIGSKKKENTKE